MIRTITASIGLLIASVRGAFAIHKAVKGPGTPAEKVAAVRKELENILDKLKSLAETTEPEWDDRLADILSEVLRSIADALIEGLEER